MRGASPNVPPRPAHRDERTSHGTTDHLHRFHALHCGAPEFECAPRRRFGLPRQHPRVLRLLHLRLRSRARVPQDLLSWRRLDGNAALDQHPGRGLRRPPTRRSAVGTPRRSVRTQERASRLPAPHGCCDGHRRLPADLRPDRHRRADHSRLASPTPRALCRR